MADNKIVHRVSLEGADKVSKQLQSIGLEGEKAFQKVKQSAESSSLGGKTGEQFGGEKLEAGREAAERFREVLHTLHPILGAAGLELGNLGAYARLAGAGMGALGVAIVGSVLIGLAKLGDEADKAKRRLDLLSGAGKGGGESQFDGLKKTARDLGVDSSDLAPAAESLFRSQQNSRAADRNIIHPPNFVPGENEEAANRVQVFRGGEATPSAGLSNNTINTAIKAAAEAGKLDRTSAKDSTAALSTLYESTKGGKGQVTVDAYDTLVKASPAIGDAIAKAASGSGAGGVGQALPAGAPDLRAFLQRGGKLTGDQVLTGLARTEPDLRKQAETVPPGTTESFEHLEASAKNLAEAFSKLAGSKLFSGPLDAASKGIDKAADVVEHNVEKIKGDAARGYELGSKTHIPGAGVAGGILGADVGVLRNIGGDILKEVGKSTKEQFEAGPLGQFLTKAATDPGALQEKQRPDEGPQAPRSFEGTQIPSPLPSAATLAKINPIAAGAAALFPSASDALKKKSPDETVIPSPASQAPVDQAIADFKAQADKMAELKPAVPDVGAQSPKKSEQESPAVEQPQKTNAPLDKAVYDDAVLAAAPATAAHPPATTKTDESFSRDPLDTGEGDGDYLKRFVDEWVKQNAPSSQPVAASPQPATNGPRSEAEPVQHVADLGSTLRDILSSVAAALNNAKGQDNKITGPVDAIGIRGEAAPTGDDATRKVADLGAAAEDAAAKLRGVEAPATAQVAHAASGGSIVRMAEGGQARLNVSPGGHLSGPGTGKSDSIPADVANGEFVVNAKDTAKNIELLHDINSGKDVGHYADGGQVQPPTAKPKAPELRGDLNVVYDPNTGGAYINGGLYLPGDPVLNQPEIKAAIDRSKASANEKPTKQKSGSSFLRGAIGGNYGGGGFAEGGLVGRFAEGGSVGGSQRENERGYSPVHHFAKGGAVEALRDRFEAMGFAKGGEISTPPLDIGLPDISEPDLSTRSTFNKPAASSSMENWGMIDLRSNHGDFKVATERDTMRHLSSSAQKARRFSTGAKPNWYGGGQ